jgi:hypothetical protein
MSREELEELAWRLRELARSLANRASEDSSTSSRPPSSDDPYRREDRSKPVAAGAVRGPRHIVRRGKTPVLDPAEARQLID